MSKLRWGQFLRAKRQEIYCKLKQISDFPAQEIIRVQERALVEEIRLNDQFEETVDRRAGRTVKFMEQKYKEYIDDHREKR